MHQPTLVAIPALTLDDLCTDWLARRMAGLAAMPGLNNDIGSIQMEADPAFSRFHGCTPNSVRTRS